LLRGDGPYRWFLWREALLYISYGNGFDEESGDRGREQLLIEKRGVYP
jgi:hypothetical protein